jgi:PAS domain S-box-containing protein
MRPLVGARPPLALVDSSPRSLAPARGTRTSVKPRTPVRRRQRQPLGPNSRAEPEPAHILVIDDRPEVLRLVNRALGKRYECKFASNVEEARVKFGNGTFQLALCEIDMAGRSGLDFAEEIFREHSDTSVILVTCEDNPEVAEQAFDFRAHGYLVSPFSSGQLLISTMNALRRRELEIAASEHSSNLEARLQTIIDMAPIPIYAKDASHRYVLANARADELGGLKRGRLLGQTDEAIMPHEAAEAVAGVDRRILDGGPAYDEEETMAIGGIERTFQTVKFPLLDEQDQISAVCGISIDVTAKREAIGLRDELAAAQQQAIDELRLSRQETVERLTKAIQHHDPSTGEHVRRMAAIASFLGSQLHLDPERVHLLRAAAPMHDVGKIGTSDEILRKPEPLNDEERKEVERHTVIGHEILANSESELMRIAANIALTHHERYDGTGYPQGLVGEEIPLEGRITAVADVFDALLSDRSYRPALPVAQAAAVMRDGRGTHFDPQIVDVLLDNLEDALYLRRQSSVRKTTAGASAAKPVSCPD